MQFIRQHKNLFFTLAVLAAAGILWLATHGGTGNDDAQMYFFHFFSTLLFYFSIHTWHLLKFADNSIWVLNGKSKWYLIMKPHTLSKNPIMCAVFSF